jgi:hypothetical protein
MVAGGGLLTALFTAMQHHTVAAVQGAPQSGDMREGPSVPVQNGDRKGDIK